jgi:predicted site-specific integrase-resolvase
MSDFSDLPRWLSKRAKAAQLGVSDKTVDRWRHQGLIKQPKIVNGRCYFDAADEPRSDDEAA